VSSSTVERRAFNPEDGGSSPLSPTDLGVVSIPSLLLEDALVQLMHSEANFLNDLEADEREWMIDLQRETSLRLEQIVVHGRGS
jgi:hypothetical protein